MYCTLLAIKSVRKAPVSDSVYKTHMAMIRISLIWR